MYVCPAEVDRDVRHGQLLTTMMMMMMYVCMYVRCVVLFVIHYMSVHQCFFVTLKRH